jgi:DnaJ-class molecular chaperone
MPNSKKQSSSRCSVCRGTGRKDGKVCPVCDGEGEISAKPHKTKKK